MMSDEMAKQFASSLSIADIKSFIEAHQEEFHQYLLEQERKEGVRK